MEKKVVGLIFGLMLAICISAFSISEKPAANPKSFWVDSVYSKLTLDQKIKKLLFPVIHNKHQDYSSFGGVIVREQSLGETPKLLPEIQGYLPVNPLFQTFLKVDKQILSSTNHQGLVRRATAMATQKLVSSGFEFILMNKMPVFSQKEIIQESLEAGYIDGIRNDGLMIWSKAGNDADLKSFQQNLSSVVNKTGERLSEFSKRDLKKLKKTLTRSAQLIYHLADFEDPFLDKAIQLTDILIIDGDEDPYIQQYREAYEQKDIKKKELEAKVKKVLGWQYEARRVIPVFDQDPIEEKVLIREIQEKSIVVVQNEEDILPIRHLDNQRFASLSLGIFDNEEFQEYLDNYTYFSHYGEADFITNRATLLDELLRYDHIVVRFSFPDYVDLTNQEVLDRVGFLNQISHLTDITVSVFGDTKWLSLFGFTDALILAHNPELHYQQIVPQIIFGGRSATGKLTKTLNEDFSAGAGIETKDLRRLAYTIPERVGFDPLVKEKIDYLINSAIASEATPGCQVLVARKGEVIINSGYGHFTYDSTQAVTPRTIYDLASVTKVTGTLQATMFLEGNRLLDLDQKASFYLEELIGTNKEDLQIRKILTHQAGLWPYFPFYKKTLTGDRLNPVYYHSEEDYDYNQYVAPGVYGHDAIADSVWNWTITSDLRTLRDSVNGFDYRYSDLGFLIMKELNEKLINQPMDEFLDQNFYSPLGMSTTGYQPLKRFGQNDIAPTEFDDTFRKGLVWGTVHDENAALNGGVDGHAGLFSTANDLAKLLQMNLQDGKYGDLEYLRSGSVNRFSAKQFDKNRRGLGWDKPSRSVDYQNASKYSSEQSYGHLGFTGTAIWVDPEYELIYIFLSNRVYPNRENTKLMADNIRSRIHDIIYESMPEFREGS
ncbi:MAG: serine hydrolase [Cyclobacteriaceae bacterium]